MYSVLYSQLVIYTTYIHVCVLFKVYIKVPIITIARNVMMHETVVIVLFIVSYIV